MIDNHQKPSEGIQADRHEPLFTVHILILFCECIGIEKDAFRIREPNPVLSQIRFGLCRTQTILMYVYYTYPASVKMSGRSVVGHFARDPSRSLP